MLTHIRFIEVQNEQSAPVDATIDSVDRETGTETGVAGTVTLGLGQLHTCDLAHLPDDTTIFAVVEASTDFVPPGPSSPSPGRPRRPRISSSVPERTESGSGESGNAAIPFVGQDISAGATIRMM
jgi:hypothetical protein